VNEGIKKTMHFVVFHQGFCALWEENRAHTLLNS
jgi:hypothetical protein